MRAVLAGLCPKGKKREETLDSIRELKGLVKAVGGKVIGYLIQVRDEPDPRFFIGEGKANQLKEIIKGTGADTLVLDDPLTPSQVRNLERVTGIRVIDRTDLVLEIFSRRARSKEAKLQVELAKLTHELPRLYGKGKALSRLGGGVGTRGPGEQEAEVRKRVIKNRIHQIKKELQEVKRMRKHQRKRRSVPREGERILKVAIVGYTNAGKSTLLKTLTSRETEIADMLFATLDTTTSSRRIGSDIKLLFTDTVGFINKLPPELIESFKTTLEEVSESDILLHVVDISDDKWLDHIQSVKNILKELGAEDKPTIYVLNKADRVVRREEDLGSLPHPVFVEGASVLISASKRWNIDSLLKTILKTASGIEVLTPSKTA